MTALAEFLEKAEKKAFDKEHRKRINFNMGKYRAAVVHGKEQFSDIELARQRASSLKRKVIENLDYYLTEFETNFLRNGGKLIWAENSAEAVSEILNILNTHDVKTVVKSKSMVSEEIHLNDALAKSGIEPLETDLGEYIQQLDGEPPYHIVTPAMHKSKEDIAELFHNKLGVPEGLKPEELTMEARRRLRKKYREAGAGITGANFLLADIGGIAITENEGNARLSTSLPDIHIAVVGIEKLLPSVNDLHLFWPLLATFGTGQMMTNYNTIFTGPRKPGEKDGPKRMYVILLDNGRSNILQLPKQRQALSCIRCGACLNACPVYQNIGGHTYGRTYSGPIGSVLSPFFGEMDDNIHLSQASSLCGNCTQVCPVKIELHHLLLLNRQLYTEKYHAKTKDKLTWFFWKKGMLNRKLMNTGNSTIKNQIFKMLFKNSWGKRRALPQFPNKSFNELWREKYGSK